MDGGLVLALLDASESSDDSVSVTSELGCQLCPDIRSELPKCSEGAGRSAWDVDCELEVLL